MTTFQKLIIVFLFTSLGLWFLWFQYRPSELRKYCHEVSYSCAENLRDTEAQSGDFYAKQRQQKGTVGRSDRESCYQRCLNSKGL